MRVSWFVRGGLRLPAMVGTWVRAECGTACFDFQIANINFTMRQEKGIQTTLFYGKTPDKSLLCCSIPVHSGFDNPEQCKPPAMFFLRCRPAG
jgi:hypothetical protein